VIRAATTILATLLLTTAAYADQATWDRYEASKVQRAKDSAKIVDDPAPFNWTWEVDRYNVGLALAFTALCIVDWQQTLEIKHHPEKHEANRILGDHPSDGRVNTYFAIAIPAINLLTLAVPNPVRYWVQGTLTMIEFSYVDGNWAGGLRGHW
jgi:hypothetical protein